MSTEKSCCAPDCCDETETDTAVAQNAHRENIREVYEKVANANAESDCDGPAASCCGTSDDQAINALISTRLGYSQADLDIVPEGANMGLGCGDPAIAGILSFSLIFTGFALIGLGIG